MSTEYERLSDDELKKMLAYIESELQKREKGRKQKAKEQIRSIAVAAGLSVEVSDKPKRKRGRPAKRRQGNE